MTPIGTFLNGSTAIQLRGVTFLALSEVGHRVQGTVTSDSAGGGTVVWTAGSAIPCRIESMGGNESLIAGAVSDQATHTVWIPAFTEIEAEDKFAIDNRGTFEVLSVSDRTAEQIRQIEVLSLE